MPLSPARYYPYKKPATLLFPIWFTCFGVFLLCAGISSGDLPSCAAGVITLVGTFFMWKSFRAMKGIFVDIADDELIYVDRGECIPQSRQMADFRYAYLARSLKGHVYLIFSMRQIEPEHQRRLASQCASKSRLLIEDYVIVYLDTSKQANAFREKAETKYPELINEMKLLRSWQK